MLALGYKAEVVKNFFLQFADMASDLTIDLGADRWKIHLIDRLTSDGRLPAPGLLAMHGHAARHGLERLCQAGTPPWKCW